MADRLKKRKLRIAINALSATIGGGVTFIRNIIPALSAYDLDNDYYVFVDEGKYDHIYARLKFGPNVIFIKIRTYNLIVRLIQEQVLLPYFVLKYRIDILVSPANIATFFAPCKKMLWVLNIYTYFRLPIKGETPLEKLRYKLLDLISTWSIRYSDVSLYISEFSRQSVIRIVKVDPARTKTIYLGVASDEFRKGSVLPLGRHKEYILSVSSISKRKNYEVLMRAYAQLSAEMRARYNVMLVGDVDEEMKRYLLDCINDEGIKKNIIFTGKVSNEALYLHYRQASIFVLPSLVEAFGLPVIEAMAAGLPVLVADATSLPEIAGDAGIIFDPYDPIDLARKIEQVLRDTSLAREMTNKGVARAKLFTWENTARQMVECYQ